MNLILKKIFNSLFCSDVFTLNRSHHFQLKVHKLTLFFVLWQYNSFGIYKSYHSLRQPIPMSLRPLSFVVHPSPCVNNLSRNAEPIFPTHLSKISLFYPRPGVEKNDFKEIFNFHYFSNVAMAEPS